MDLHPKLKAMLAGYGPDFPKDIRDILIFSPSDETMTKLNSPIPGLGRYASSVAFLKEVTSAKKIGLLRFEILKKYFFLLEAYVGPYDGKFKNQKVVTILPIKDLMALGKLCTTPEDVIRAELIEKFTDHDTAAAGDYLKMCMAYLHPHLADFIDGVHFANTSEDVMSNVFGIIGNELVFGHFLNTLSQFCLDLIKYAQIHEAGGPLILPGFTHRQAAEPTTLGKKFAVRLNAIARLVKTLIGEDGNFMPFSGKLGGAIGNLTCHYAAYPDINWWAFARRFVTELGLHYEELTDQCTSYVEEARIFTTVENILTQVVKITDDFVDMASCPAQFFVKRKKTGEKGSSLMPNKSNAWAMEGAMKMLKEAQGHLHLLARELPNYPHEGDMGRSYLFRNVGNVFMPIFIALKRISGELKKYQPNPKKIQWTLDEYPGMAASSLQTILKRASVPGDAYRALQGISVNEDGSYASYQDFRNNLLAMMHKLCLPADLQKELLSCLEFNKLVEPAHQLARKELPLLEIFFQSIQRRAEKYIPQPNPA